VNTSHSRFKISQGTTGWSNGIHDWVVRVEAESINVCIGISRKEIDPTDGNEDIAFMICCYDGVLFGPNIDDDVRYFVNVPSDGLPAGSLVCVHLDLDLKTLTFGLNGKWNDGPAFCNIPPDTWFPFVELGHEGTSVTIVRN
jgi:hypothetical protein